MAGILEAYTRMGADRPGGPGKVVSVVARSASLDARRLARDVAAVLAHRSLEGTRVALVSLGVDSAESIEEEQWGSRPTLHPGALWERDVTSDLYVKVHAPDGDERTVESIRAVYDHVVVFHPGLDGAPRGARLVLRSSDYVIGVSSGAHVGSMYAPRLAHGLLAPVHKGGMMLDSSKVGIIVQTSERVTEELRKASRAEFDQSRSPGTFLGVLRELRGSVGGGRSTLREMGAGREMDLRNALRAAGYELDDNRSETGALQQAGGMLKVAFRRKETIGPLEERFQRALQEQVAWPFEADEVALLRKHLLKGVSDPSDFAEILTSLLDTDTKTSLRRLHELHEVAGLVQR